MCGYLRTKFQVPRTTLTRSRKGGNFTPQSQNEQLKSPLRLGLKIFLSNLVQTYSYMIDCIFNIIVI